MPLTALPNGVNRVNAIAALHQIQDLGYVRLAADTHVQQGLSWKVTVNVVYATMSRCTVTATGEAKQKQKAKLEAAELILQHIGDVARTTGIQPYISNLVLPTKIINLSPTNTALPSTTPTSPTSSVSSLSSDDSHPSSYTESASSTSSDCVGTVSSASSASFLYSDHSRPSSDTKSASSTNGDCTGIFSSASSGLEMTERQQLQVTLARGNIRVMESITRALTRGKPAIILAIDIEASRCGKPVEIGVTKINLTSRDVSSSNIRVKEYINLPMFYELAGPTTTYTTTETLPLHVASIRINKLLDEVMAARAGCIVGHAMQNDVKWLAHLGIDLSYLPKSDTSTLGMLLARSCKPQGLERACAARGLAFLGHPHCAGDDAYMTAKLWVTMVHEHTGYQLLEDLQHTSVYRGEFLDKV